MTIKFLLFLMAFLISGFAKAQDQVISNLCQHPPNQFIFEMFWEIILNNTSQQTLNKYLSIHAFHDKNCKITETKNKSFQLKTDLDLVITNHKTTILDAGLFQAGADTAAKALKNCTNCEKNCKTARCWDINGKCYCY